MHLWWWSKGGVDLDEKTITNVLLEEEDQSFPVPLDALVLFFFSFPATPAQHSSITHKAPSTYNRCEDGAISSHQSGE